MNIKKGFKEYREYIKSPEYLFSTFGTYNRLINWEFLDFLIYTKEQREQKEKEEVENLKLLLKKLESGELKI